MKTPSGRVRRGGHRVGKVEARSNETERASTVDPAVEAATAARAVETALTAARRRGTQLRSRQRFLFATAVAGLAIVGGRGIASIAWPAREGAMPVAVGLGLGLVVFTALFAYGIRTCRRAEQLARDVQLLELAREMDDVDATPRVQVHPYRTHDGVDCPVVVVRTDSIERLFRSDDPPPEGSRRPSPVARALAAVAVVATIALMGSILFGARSVTRSWRFLDETRDPEALGFRTPGERGGRWAVEDHEAATGARALVNRVGEDGAPPSTLVVASVNARDLRVATRCKVAPDRAGKACGAVFRFVDSDNYHVARIDLEAKQIVVATVRGGEEHVLRTMKARVEAGVWQELSVEARGDSINVSCNGRETLEVLDPLPGPYGSGGLWAPSASEAYFDELAVETLPARAQSMEVLPLLRKGAS